MLTMNEFKEAVTKDFKRFLDESFKDKEMVMYPLYKMNIAKTAISFKSSHEEMSIMPVVYLEDMYTAQIFDNILNDIKQYREPYASLVGAIFEDHHDKLLLWGGAKRNHHNMAGGLLYHICRMH